MKKYFLIVSIFLNIIGIAAFAILKNRATQKTDKKPGFMLKRNELYKLFPVNKTSKVFVGDSQIQFFNLNEFFSDTTIKNRGIIGDVTGGLLIRLQDILKDKPRKIFLQIGVNDFWNERSSVSQCIKNYKEIFRQIKLQSPQTSVYSHSILPTKLVVADTIIKCNKELEKLCITNDVTYINIYPLFNDGGKLKSQFDCGDGVHLSANGYITWKKALTPYIL